MYKDKTKQKEAVKKAVEKHRKGITEQGITGKGITLLKRPNGAYYDPEELMPLSKIKKAEYMRRLRYHARTKDCCSNCQLSKLYIDGSVRCDRNIPADRIIGFTVRPWQVACLEYSRQSDT